MSRSASVIRPGPISTRPMWPEVLFWRLMNITTPVKLSSGLSHDRSKLKTTAMDLSRIIPPPGTLTRLDSRCRRRHRRP